MMKKAMLLSGLLLLGTALFAGLSYSWYVDKEGSKMAVATGKIDTKITFECNLNKGIPGETIAISGTEEYANQIEKGYGSADYIFKLAYKVTSEEDEAEGARYITDLNLTPEKISELELVKAEDYNDNDGRIVVYYGKHKGGGALHLGQLLAGFSDKLTNSARDKAFEVKADIEACQVTKAAARDIFGIDPEHEDYAEWFQ